MPWNSFQWWRQGSSFTWTEFSEKDSLGSSRPWGWAEVGVGGGRLCLRQTPWIRCKSPHNELISRLFCAGLSSYFRTDTFHFHRELAECLEFFLEKGICLLLCGRKLLPFFSSAPLLGFMLQAFSELDVPDSELQNCCRQTGWLDTQHLKHHGWKDFNICVSLSLNVWFN